jgi:hypothetical protein
VGLDFSALIQTNGLSADVVESIDRLESTGEDAAFARVVNYGLSNDFSFARCNDKRARWRSMADWNQILPRRPHLPSLEARLHLPSDFCLTFGHDAVWVYHSLRWISFLTEVEWQRVILAAVKRFCGLLRARDCIVTNDENPAVLEFLRGTSFVDALRIATKNGEGEEVTLNDLYREVEDESDVAMKPADGPLAKYLEGQLVQWPRSKALPKGWSRPLVWESKGFWRYHWRHQ